jgi:hypothetical protein
VLINNKVVWLLFASFAGATVFAYKTAWALHYYVTLLGALGVCTLISAVFVLRATGLKVVPTVVVCGVLLYSQSWFVLGFIIVVGGRLMGFGG